MMARTCQRKTSVMAWICRQIRISTRETEMSRCRRSALLHDNRNNGKGRRRPWPLACATPANVDGQRYCKNALVKPCAACVATKPKLLRLNGTRQLQHSCGQNTKPVASCKASINAGLEGGGGAARLANVVFPTPGLLRQPGNPSATAHRPHLLCGRPPSFPASNVLAPARKRNQTSPAPPVWPPNTIRLSRSDDANDTPTHPTTL